MWWATRRASARRRSASCLAKLEPYRTHERGSGEPSRWKSDEELVWEGLRPELVVEVAFDHITGNRIRHGAKLLRWSDDKDPSECRHLAAAFLILLLAAPSGAVAQVGVSYEVPSDNPFVGQDGARPEVYAIGLRNPYRFSFDRETGDVLIGDVGGGLREEIDWIGSAAARGANFGWACREGTVAGRAPGLPAAGRPLRQPLFDYPNDSPDAVTAGFIVRDASLTGAGGPGPVRRLLHRRHRLPEARGRERRRRTTTGATVPWLAAFGQDASGRLYAANHQGGAVVRLVAGPTPGTLATQALTGPFDQPISIGTFPGTRTGCSSARRRAGASGSRWRGAPDSVSRRGARPPGSVPRASRVFCPWSRAPDYADLGTDLRVLHGRRRRHPDRGVHSLPGERRDRRSLDPQDRARDRALVGVKPQRRPAAVRPRRLHVGHHRRRRRGRHGTTRRTRRSGKCCAQSRAARREPSGLRRPAGATGPRRPGGGHDAPGCRRASEAASARAAAARRDRLRALQRAPARSAAGGRCASAAGS